jgi:8-amino-7-oxononanoate synthase
LLQTARSYIYTTAAPPALAHALAVSLAIIRDDAPRRARLTVLVERFRAGAQSLPWKLLASPTPIQPLVVGESAAAVELSEALFARGIWVPAIRPPTVPKGVARLRISLSAAHTDPDVDRLLSALIEIASRKPC